MRRETTLGQVKGNGDGQMGRWSGDWAKTYDEEMKSLFWPLEGATEEAADRESRIAWQVICGSKGVPQELTGHIGNPVFPAIECQAKDESLDVLTPTDGHSIEEQSCYYLRNRATARVSTPAKDTAVGTRRPPWSSLCRLSPLGARASCLKMFPALLYLTFASLTYAT